VIPGGWSRRRAPVAVDRAKITTRPACAAETAPPELNRMALLWGLRVSMGTFYYVNRS